jgi:hypothetical protein
MRTRRISVFTAALVWLLVFGAATLLDGPWSATAVAQGRGGGGRGGSGGRPDPNASKAKSETYVVVQVGDRAEVVKKSEVNAYKKRLDEQYRAEVKAWDEAKRAAAKGKQPFDQPKPKKPAIKIHRKTFKTEGEAKTFADSLRSKSGGSKGGGFSPKGAEGYAVVEIDGQAKIVGKSEVADLKKKAEEDYKQATKDYNEAKKEAAKNKQPFDQPKPKKQIIKVLGPSFKTEADAKEFLEKLKAKKNRTSDRKSKKDHG